MSNLLGHSSRRGFLKATAAGTAFAAIGASAKASSPFRLWKSINPAI